MKMKVFETYCKDLLTLTCFISDITSSKKNRITPETRIYFLDLEMALEKPHKLTQPPSLPVYWEREAYLSDVSIIPVT